MIKAVIFDYGGVVKTSKDHCLKNIALAYGLPEKLINEHIGPFIEPYQKGLINENQFWKRFSLNLGKPIPRNKRELWRKSFEKDFYIYPSIIDFAQKLKAKKIKTAILSNCIKSHAEIINKKRGYQNFDVVVLSYKVHLVKPEPEIYLLTAKKLKVKPRECVFIDDKEKNLKPARKMDMKTVLAKDPRQVIKNTSRILDF